VASLVAQCLTFITMLVNALNYNHDNLGNLCDVYRMEDQVMATCTILCAY